MDSSLSGAVPSLGSGLSNNPTNCPTDANGVPQCPPSTQEVEPATTGVAQIGFSQATPVPAATTVPGDEQNPGSGGASPYENSTAVITTQTYAPSRTATGLTANSKTASSGPAAVGAIRGDSNNMSKGAVAGIAIAMLIVGAAIAFLVAFFLFKRRNRKPDANVGAGSYTSFADSAPELAMMQQKSVGMGGRNSPYVQVSQTPIHAPIPAPAPAPVQHSSSSDIASFLPPAVHDSAIHSRVSTLFGQIHRHIETYYRDVHASITPSIEPELARFGAMDVNMVELLQDCSSPTTALKHALVAYVLGITGPKNEDDGETLFPEELNCARVNHGDNIVSDANLTTATTLHRRLSVYLYTSTHWISNLRSSWSLQSDIREAAEHFLLTFFPWANPTSSDQEKEEDLARIISEALETRIWLFGQPFEYQFEWEETGRRGVLVNPGLVKRSDEGERRVVVEGTVVSI